MLLVTASLIGRSSFVSMLKSERQAAGDVTVSCDMSDAAAASAELPPHAAPAVAERDSRKRTIFDAFDLVLGFKNPALSCSNKVIQNYTALVISDGRPTRGHRAAP